jgi:hypothetical protein
MELKIMKNISIIILLSAFLLTCFGTCPAFAAVELGDGVTTIPATKYTAASEDIKIEGGYVSFEGGKWIEYTVVAPGSDIYDFSMLVGCTSNVSVKVSVNGGEARSGTLAATGGYFNLQYRVASRIELTKGENTVRIEGVTAGCYIDEVSFQIATINLHPEEKTVILSNEYMRAIKEIRHEGIHLSFQTGHWTEYVVTSEKEGYYNVSITYGSPYPLTASVTINGSDRFSATFEQAKGYTPVVTVFLAQVWLKEGRNTLRITNEAGSCYFDNVVVEPLMPIRIQQVTADDRKPKEGGDDENPSHAIITISDDGSSVVPRGYDTFKIEFNQPPLPSSVNSSNVKIISAEGEIPYEMVLEDEVLSLFIKKTLAFKTQYTIVIKGIEDLNNMPVLPETNYTFTTSASGSADKGISTAVIQSANIDGADVSITCVLLSSKGVGIAGRYIEVYMIDPDNNFHGTPISSQTSTDGGIVNISYTLPADSISGQYTFLLGFEYSTSDRYISLVYTSPEDEANILSAIKNAASASEIGNILKANENKLGVSVDTDLSGLDKNMVYEYFIGKTIPSAKELLRQYKTFAIMERINQAATTIDITDVLEGDSLRLVMPQKDMLDYIVSNKNELISDLLDMSAIKSEQQFINALEELAKKWLATEYGKHELAPSVQNKSVYKGQAVELEIGFTTTESDIKKITYVFEFNDSEILENAVLNLTAQASGTLKQQGNKLIITITSNNTLSNVSSFGNVMLPNTVKTKTYNVNVSGMVEYDVNIPYSIQLLINQKSCTFSVRENNSSSRSERSSYAPPSGSILPGDVETTPDDDNAKEDDYKFKDLDDVQWAQNSIYALVKSGIVSKNPENEFYPNDSVTREEFIKMLVAAFDLLDDTATAKFNDIDTGQWYYSYVASAQKHGIVTGDPAGNFNIGSDITREDMATVVYRVISKLGYDFSSEVSQTFADDDNISDYARDAVYTMKYMNVINGIGDNIFAPHQNATRAMAAKVIAETIKAVGI